MKRFVVTSVAVVLVVFCVAGAGAQSRKTLDIYVVEVEGGNAVLFVAPWENPCSSIPEMQARARSAMRAAS